MTDGGDGTYEVLYRVLSAVSPDRKLSLSVCLGREPISGSPFAVHESGVRRQVCLKNRLLNSYISYLDSHRAL